VLHRVAVLHRLAVSGLGYCAAGGIFGSIGVLLWQSYNWLRYGVWTELPIHTSADLIGINIITPISSIQWVGIREIAYWAANISTSMTLFVIGLVFYGFWVFQSEKVEYEYPDYWL
jgi:hypothetical protein